MLLNESEYFASIKHSVINHHSKHEQIFIASSKHLSTFNFEECQSDMKQYNHKTSHFSSRLYVASTRLHQETSLFINLIKMPFTSVHYVLKELSEKGNL